MKYLVIGDIHGNHVWMKRVIDVAVTQGIDTILQTGDFGCWPGQGGADFFDIVSRYLVKRGVKLYWVPGNHEDYNQIESWNPNDFNEDGHYENRPNLYYVGKVNRWVWNGVSFGSAGGAYSIDRKYRSPGVDWWPQEKFSTEDLIKLKKLQPVDILLTHDSPTTNPMPGMKTIVESQLHQQQMNRVGQHMRPKLWFHGHYHWYSGEYGFRHDYGFTSVYGLDADDHASVWLKTERDRLMRRHAVILDTDEMEVTLIDGDQYAS